MRKEICNQCLRAQNRKAVREDGTKTGQRCRVMKEGGMPGDDNGSATRKEASLMVEQEVADRCTCEAIEMGEGRGC
jgi:hypothetical protein